jgi:uncharacterized protein YbjT (DUF2867 family)
VALSAWIKKRLLLLGATGLVGQQVLAQAFADTGVARALLHAIRQAKPGRSWVENAEITRS